MTFTLTFGLLIAFLLGAVIASVIWFFVIKNNKQWFATQFALIEVELSRIQAQTVPEYIAKVKDALAKFKKK